MPLPFFGIGMKTDPFQSCGFCWVFQICRRIEYSTFTASHFRIWNSSARVPSPLLALIPVILPKTLLTSHSRMSNSRWVITPSWLSGSLKSLVYFFCVFLSPLLNIFCFFYVHTVSVLYCAHLCMKFSLGISDFLEDFSSLSHSIVFLCFFALITEEGFLIAPCYSSLGWKKHKLESRLLGEKSVTSYMQMTPPLWQKMKN